MWSPPTANSLHASAAENPDLFWAIRGGGGNFGVVTSFEFKLHPVGPELVSGLIVHPFAARPRAPRRLSRDRGGRARRASRSGWCCARRRLCRSCPADVHGKEILVFAVCYAGEPANAEEALAPLRALGEPIADVIGRTALRGLAGGVRSPAYAGRLQLLEIAQFHGAQRRAARHVGRLCRHACRRRNARSSLARSGAPPTAFRADATAYPHRDANFVMNVHTRWRERGDEQAAIKWAREFFAATAPHATGGVYVNFMPEDETDRVAGAYGSNYARLAALKAKYDPGNLFRLNQNVRPKA